MREGRGKRFRNIIVSLVASCGLKSIWMTLWENGSLMGQLEQNRTYQITCIIAIYSLEYLRGAPKAGDCKEKYVVVLWLCQNGYEFVGKRNCVLGRWGEISGLQISPQNQYSITSNKGDKILVLRAGAQESALAFIMKT